MKKLKSFKQIKKGDIIKAIYGKEGYIIFQALCDFKGVLNSALIFETNVPELVPFIDKSEWINKLRLDNIYRLNKFERSIYNI